MNEKNAISEAASIPGDRGHAVVARGVSMQAKVQNALALGVVVLLGGGFLAWYYTRVAAEPPPVEQTKAEAATKSEMKLPPLGPAPAKPVTKVEEPVALVDLESEEAAALLAGVDDGQSISPAGHAVPAAAYEPPPQPDPVLQRRLGGPVLIRGAGSYAEAGEESVQSQGDAPPMAAGLDGPGRPRSAGSAASVGGNSELAGMLQPTRAAAVSAGVVADRRFLLPKGAFIDCTLETAIDSSLPGMTTCITATDVWSADGAVVLLERGTKLVGETRGEVKQGHERLFVLWSEARTPTGVIVELASPGTDALGRSGVSGEVDTHFRERFGAAILISLIDAGTAALVASQSEGDSSVVLAPQGTSDVVSEVLRQTVNIAPTIRVPQGGRMQVLVARDVSFAEVYVLSRR